MFISNKILGWKDKNNETELKIIIKEDNIFILDFYGKQIKVTVSTDYPKTKEYSIEALEDTMAIQSIVGDLFEYSMKNPTIIGILNKASKLAIKRKARLTSEIDIIMKEPKGDLFDKKEYEMIKLEEELKSNALKHYKKNIKIDMNVIKLFEKEDVANIICQNYISTIKKYYNNDSVDISLKDFNIYVWNIKLRNLNERIQKQITNVNEKFGFDYIEIELIFHKDLYPLYPIEIKVIKPRFLKSLMYRISNLKMVQLDYWAPDRKPDFIINKLIEIFNEKAEIDVENELNNKTYDDGAYYPLEINLIKLSSICGELSFDFEKLDDENYKRVSTKNMRDTIITKSNNKWASGTGYGHNGLISWDIKKYEKLQEEKDNKIINSLIGIYEKMDNAIETGTFNSLIEAISGSYLIPFIRSYLYGTNFLDINKHIDVYSRVFDIIKLLIINKESIFLISEGGDKSIACIMEELSDQANDMKKMNLESDDGSTQNHINLINTINVLYEMIEPYYKEYIKGKEKVKDVFVEEGVSEFRLVNNINVPTITINQYCKEMKSEIYMAGDILKDPNWGHRFRNNQDTVLKAEYRLRVASEMSAIKKSCPISFESSIFVRKDQNKHTYFRGAIAGPDDTPYDSGLFFFDGFIHSIYPEKPPSFKMLNTNGNRHNPNIYGSSIDDGKVCLSLLGTWDSSNPAETWNAKTSTISQIFISVQSLILVPEPYYNEPGHEGNMGKDECIKMVKSYNLQRRIYTMSDCMNSIIENPVREFEDLIRKHFTLKKNYIIALTEKWVKEAEEFDKLSSNEKRFYHDDENKWIEFGEKTKNERDRLLKNLQQEVLDKIQSIDESDSDSN